MIDTAMMRRLMICCGMEDYVIDNAAMRLAKAIWVEASNFEREACAKVCEEKAAGWEDRLGNDISDEYVRVGKIAAAQIAASIRMRANVGVEPAAEAEGRSGSARTTG